MSGQESSPYSWRRSLATAALAVGGSAMAAGCGSNQEENDFTVSMQLYESIEEVSSEDCEKAIRHNLKEDNTVMDNLESDVCASIPFAEGFRVYESFEKYSENEDNVPDELIIFVVGAAVGGIGATKMRKS